MFEKTTFPSGLRLLTVPMNHVASAAVLVMAKAGSRYERQRINGLAHFLEHMFFKGSRRYPTAKKISLAIEGVGGTINGWTDLEEAAYWVKVPKRHLNKGIDLLGDIVLNSKFDPLEIERERGVILEEINRREDNPEQRVLEVLFEALFPNHPLGRRTLGTKEIIKKISQQDFLTYFKNFYRPGDMIVAVGGRIEKGEVAKEVASQFLFPTKTTPGDFEKFKDTQVSPVVNVYPKKTEQAHLVLGLKTFPAGHPDRFTLAVLDSLLGKGISSRLFQNIREKKGLAYSIYSAHDFYQDTGVFLIHAGLNLGKVKEAILATLEELRLLKEKEVSPRELSQAKEKIKGPLTFILEEPMTLATFFTHQELLEKEVLAPQEMMERIDKVTVNDIKRLAKDLFLAQKLNLALVGPFEDRQGFQKLLEF